MVNQGFYVPSNTCFIPHTLKKVHNVTKEEEVININTHYGNSYPAIFKNVVVTAKAI